MTPSCGHRAGDASLRPRKQANGPGQEMVHTQTKLVNTFIRHYLTDRLRERQDCLKPNVDLHPNCDEGSCDVGRRNSPFHGVDDLRGAKGDENGF